MALHCQECGLKAPSTRTDRAEPCSRCGGQAFSGQKSGSAGEPSKVVKVYTGVLIAWALIFPFLVPIIIKLSRAGL
jgi:hypothetical protein